MTVTAGWSARVTIKEEDAHECDPDNFFTPQTACTWLDFTRPEVGYDYRTFIAADFNTANVFPSGAQNPKATAAIFTIGKDGKFGQIGSYRFKIEGDTYEPMPNDGEGDCHDPEDYVDNDWEVDETFPSTLQIGAYWGSVPSVGYLGSPEDPLHYIVTECSGGWRTGQQTQQGAYISGDELSFPGTAFGNYYSASGVTRLMLDYEGLNGYGLLLRSHMQSSGKPYLVLEHGDVIKGSPAADGELDFSGTCTQCSGNVTVTRLTSGSVHVAGDNSATGHCRNPKQAEFVFDTADLWDAPTVAGGTLKFHVKSILNADVDTPKIRVYAKADSDTPSVGGDDFIGCATGFTDLGTTGTISSNGWVTFSFADGGVISKTGLTKFVLVDASTSGEPLWAIDFEISTAESVNDPSLTIAY